MRGLWIAAALLLSSEGLAKDGEQRSEAERLLRKAEELVAKHRHRAAVRAYEKVAKEYPETEAGRIGAERSRPTAYLGWADVLRNGPSRNRVDVVVLGDGYRLEDQDAFDRTVENVADVFKRRRVLGEYFHYHNFIRVNLVSKDPYPDGHGRQHETVLNGHLEGGSESVHVEQNLVFDYLERVPEHDGVAIVYVQRGAHGVPVPASPRGDGGIATVGGLDDGDLVRDWAYAFAGLGTESVSDREPRQQVRTAPNVSGAESPVPWQHWIDAHAHGIDVYEGADLRTHGAWRPSNLCAMNSPAGALGANVDNFCVVCREALVLRIYRFVDPIDTCSPEPQGLDEKERALRGDGKLLFDIQVMRPKKHRIAVDWWMLPADQAPRTPASPAGGDRLERGPLPPIDAKPVESSAGNRYGHHKFHLDTGDMAPGLYRVVCRAVDPTVFRGERLPWVLKDEHDLLKSERAWWVLVGQPED